MFSDEDIAGDVFQYVEPDWQPLCEGLPQGPDDDDRAALKRGRGAAGAQARASRAARGPWERRDVDETA